MKHFPVLKPIKIGILFIVFFIFSILCNSQTWQFNITDDYAVSWRDAPLSDGKTYNLTKATVDGNDNDPNHKNRCVSLWNTNLNNYLHLNQNFMLKFRVNFGDRLYYQAQDVGADGVVFIMSKSAPNNRIGISGGNLGYTFTQNNLSHTNDPSFAIEFDTFYNSGIQWGDPIYNQIGYDHIQYVKDGRMDLSGAYNTPVPISGTIQTPYDVENGDLHCIIITWKAADMRLNVYFDNDPVAKHSFTWPNGSNLSDIISDITNDSDAINWGFTASTGTATNTQTIIFDKIYPDRSCDFDLIIDNIPTGSPNYNVCQDRGNPYKICYEPNTQITLHATNIIPNMIPTSYTWYKKLINDATFTQFTNTNTADPSICFENIPTSSTVYKVEVTVDGCTTSDEITVEVINENVTFNPNKICLKPIPQTITINAPNIAPISPNNIYDDWTISPNTSNPPVLSNKSLNSVTLNVPNNVIPGIYTVTYKIHNNSVTPSCVFEGSLEVAIEDLNVDITPTPPKKLCLGGEVNITATGSGSVLTSPIYTYLWSFSGSGNPFKNGNNVSTVTVDQAGTYTVVCSDEYCTTTKTVIVEASTFNVVANPSSIQKNCLADFPITLNVIPSGQSGTVTYNWSTSDGAFTGSTNIPNPQVSKDGTYHLVAKDEDLCEQIVDIIVTLDPLQITSIDISKTICNISDFPVILTPHVINNINTLTYQWSGPHTPNDDVDFTNPAQKTVSTPAVVKPGTYSLTVTSESGCTATATINVVNQDFKVTIEGRNFCDDEASINLTANPTIYTPTHNYEYSWTGPSSYTATTKVVTISNTGKYYVTVTDLTTGCTASNEIEINRFTVDAPETTYFCVTPGCNNYSDVRVKINNAFGDVLILIYKSTNNGTSWTSDGIFNLFSPSEFIHTIVSPLVNQLKIVLKEILSNCEVTKIIEVRPETLTGSVLPERNNLCIGESVKLLNNITSSSLIEHFEWTPRDGLSDPNILSPIATPEKESTIYTLKATTHNGCVCSFSCTVNLSRPAEDFLKSYYDNSGNISEQRKDNASVDCAVKTQNCSTVLGGAEYFPTCIFSFLQPYIMKVDKNGDKIWDKRINLFKNNSNSECCNGDFLFTPYARLNHISNSYNFDGIQNFPGARVNDGYIGSLLGANIIPLYLLVPPSPIKYRMSVIKINEFNDLPTSYIIKSFHQNSPAANLSDIPNKIIQTFSQSRGQGYNYNGYILIGSAETIDNYTDYKRQGFIFKIDRDLNLLWGKTFGGSEIEELNDVIELENGDLILLGSSNSYNGNTNQVYLIKVNGTNGNTVGNIFTYNYRNSLNNDITTKGKNILKLADGSGFVISSMISYVDNSINKYDAMLFKINNNLEVISNNGPLRIRTNLSDWQNDPVSIIQNPNNNIGVYIDSRRFTDQNATNFNYYSGLVELNPDLNVTIPIFQKKIVNYSTSDNFCNFSKHIEEGHVGSVGELISMDKSGYAYLLGSTCYPGHSENVEFIFGRTKNISLDNCYIDANYTLEQNGVISRMTLSNPTSFFHDNLDFDATCTSPCVESYTMATSDLCPTKTICYCDEERIKVEVEQKDRYSFPPAKCCYTIRFKSTYTYDETCNIQWAKIDGTNIEFSLNNMQKNSSIPADDLDPYSFCLEEFEGKQIIIHYLDASKQNIICSSVIYLNCKCKCEDYGKKWDNLDIKVESASQDADKCCFDVFIKNNNLCAFRNAGFKLTIPADFLENVNTDITPESGWAWDGILKELRLLQSYQINGEPNKNNWIKIARICSKRGFGSRNVDFEIISSISECNHKWSFDLKCKECCEKLHSTITSDSYYDDGANCCFKLKLVVNPDLGCGGLKYVKIVDMNGNSIKQFPDNSIPIGTSFWDFCVKYTDFKGKSTMNVKIQFFNSNDQLICDYTGVINSCNKVPVPCTPDYNLFPWEDNQTGTVDFPCPSNPSITCHVTFTYTYRHIKDGNVSIHRDIQILNYKVNADCNCSDEIIKQMIMSIWSSTVVMNEFDIPFDPTWPNNSPRCFDNFRVITSDCWDEAYAQGANGSMLYRKKCDDFACCYATYRVCYFKDGDGNISFSSFSILSNVLITPQSCTQPCVPNNCQNWHPHDGNISMNKRFIWSDENQDNLCNVFIVYGKDKSNISINLECELTGKISLQFFDLLGNVLYQKEVVKDGFELSIPLNGNLTSGIYFVKINIDNNLLYYNKLNIIK